MEGVAKARRGYSRDSRSDCKQLVIVLIVTPEGFPLSYEVFAGNRADVTTLDEMITAVEGKYGRARRVWVFDRGIVREENLAKLRERGMPYLVGTPKSRLKQYEAQLLQSDWKRIADRKVEVKFLPEAEEVYVLCRSSDRATKEAAMRQHQLRGLMRTLIRLRAIASSLTPWQALDLLGRIQLVEVWFQLKDGRWLCLPRITQPEPAQAVLLHQLGWQLPQQPPPRIDSHQIVEPLSQLSIEPENTA